MENKVGEMNKEWLEKRAKLEEGKDVEAGIPAPVCEICGQPMPKGEEMLKYHGYSGPCPKPATNPEPESVAVAPQVENKCPVCRPYPRKGYQELADGYTVPCYACNPKEMLMQAGMEAITKQPSSPSVGAQEKQPIKESSPVACLAFLPRIVKVAKENGYALTLHGTLTRDYDFVAVPWIDGAVSPEELVETIRAACGGLIFDNERDGPTPKPMPHGRLAWKIHLGGGPYLDLSVMPRAALAPTQPQPRKFKGFVAIGCGKHVRNAMGSLAYGLDCLDCQKQPMMAWWEGSQPQPQLSAQTEEARELLEVLALGRTHFSRDHDDSVPFPYEHVFSIPQWKKVEAAAEKLRAAMGKP